MIKPTTNLCAQQRLRSAWASVQSDQHLRCLHEETLGPKLPIQRTVKALIRLAYMQDPPTGEKTLMVFPPILWSYGGGCQSHVFF